MCSSLYVTQGLIRLAVTQEIGRAVIGKAYAVHRIALSAYAQCLGFQAAERLGWVSIYSVLEPSVFNAPHCAVFVILLYWVLWLRDRFLSLFARYELISSRQAVYAMYCHWHMLYEDVSKSAVGFLLWLVTWHLHGVPKSERACRKDKDALLTLVICTTDLSSPQGGYRYSFLDEADSSAMV